MCACSPDQVCTTVSTCGSAPFLFPPSLHLSSSLPDMSLIWLRLLPFHLLFFHLSFFISCPPFSRLCFISLSSSLSHFLVSYFLPSTLPLLSILSPSSCCPSTLLSSLLSLLQNQLVGFDLPPAALTATTGFLRRLCAR